MVDAPFVLDGLRQWLETWQCDEHFGAGLLGDGDELFAPRIGVGHDGNAARFEVA
ncbi:MAG: hypothetical protein IPL28_24455 [Chloroflexi bacterium]|nr:hypothetical protein [Chloroflexota bacterium]